MYGIQLPRRVLNTLAVVVIVGLALVAWSGQPKWLAGVVRSVGQVLLTILDYLPYVIIATGAVCMLVGILAIIICVSRVYYQTRRHS